jgi:hypothetical protein
MLPLTKVQRNAIMSKACTLVKEIGESADDEEFMSIIADMVGVKYARQILHSVR